MQGWDNCYAVAELPMLRSCFACCAPFRTTGVGMFGWREKLPEGGQLLRSCRAAHASLHHAPLRSCFSPFRTTGVGMFGWREKLPEGGGHWQLDGPGAQPPGPRRNLVSLSTHTTRPQSAAQLSSPASHIPEVRRQIQRQGRQGAPADLPPPADPSYIPPLSKKRIG